MQHLEAGGTLIFDTRLELKLRGGELLCDVLDADAASRRCETEFEVMVENVRRAAEASGLDAILPDVPRRWRVVDTADFRRGILWSRL